MALQWRETSFLASQSAARVQVPIDFAVEEPEEDLDFILEVEEAIKPTRVEISEGFSSNNESEDGAQNTATEVKRDSVARATSEGAPVTLEELQNELQMMQRETQVLQNLLVSNGGSGGEAAQGMVEAWQQRNVFQGVARSADAGMVSVGVTSTTSQVMYRRQHTEEVVTHRRSASRRLRRPRPGNRGYISSSSDDSPELPRFRDMRDTIPRAPKENKGTRISGNAAKEDPGRATDATPVTQVTEDATVTEAISRNGDVSHTKVQAAGNPVAEKVSKEMTTTEDRVIEDLLTENSVRERGMADEGLRESTTDEIAMGVTIAEEPVRVEGATAEYVNGNRVTEQLTREEKVTEETNTENIASEELLQKAAATEEQLIEQVPQEDPSHNKDVPAEHDTTQHLSPEDQDTTDANNGRRSRSSYHNMIEEMGYSSEDNLSDEWKEEDFEETNFMTTSESPDVSEPTEIAQVAMAGTDDGSAAQYEKSLPSETPGKNIKPSKPTGTRRKSSLGAETVVKPYLETNLDNPVLYYLEKVSEARSPSPSTPSKEPNGDVSEVGLLNLESEKKPQSSEATGQKLDTAEEPNEKSVFEHITKETDQAKTESLEMVKLEELLQGGDTQDVVNEPPSHLVTHSDTGTSPQPSEDTEIVASPTITSPVASEEETLRPKHGGRSAGKRRPSQKPPPPPRTSSLLPSDAEPQSQVGTLPNAPPSTPDPTSPHGSVGSSSSSLESEAPASENVVLREQGDHPHVDGLKRVSAVYEELEKIDIPRVPSPPPLEAASKSQDLLTPNINKSEALNSASILPEEPALLDGLQKEHMIAIPETSNKAVQQSATDPLVASPSLSAEGTSMFVADSESSDGQHKFLDEGSETTTSKPYTSEESLPSSLEHIPEDTRKSPSQSHPQVSPPLAAVDETDPSGMSLTQGWRESPDRSLDSDSLLTEHLETPSPILSESPGLILSDLEKIDIPGIPPPPPRHPPPTVASQASLSPVAEAPSSQVSKDSPALHSTMPLAQVLFDLEKMDIPGVPPPPPRQPPPPPPVQSTASPPLEASLQAIPEETIIPSDTCSSSANESFIQPSEGSSDDSAVSESSFCDSNDSAARKDDEETTQTPITFPLQKSFNHTETVLERLESLEIPEVPPPPPVGSPPAIAMQSSPIQLCGPSSLIEGDFPPEFKETSTMKVRSCSPSLSFETSQGHGVEIPSSRRLKELEEMEIPEVPPPLPRQPPPKVLDPTQTTIIETHKTQTRETSDGPCGSPLASNTKSCQRRFLESLQGQTPEVTRPQSLQSSAASCLTQESPSTCLSYSPVNPSIPSHQLLVELEEMEIPEVPPPPPLQPPPSLDPLKIHSADSFQDFTPRTSEVCTTPSYDVLSETEPHKKLGGDTVASETSPTPTEETESPPMSMNLGDSFPSTAKELQTLSNLITSPQVAKGSPSNLLENLEKMEIPEVPPPPPRRPLPPPPRSLPPQHPLPYPRHSELSSTSDSSSPFAAHTDWQQTPASSSTSTPEDSPASTPQPFTTHTSEVSPKQGREISAAEASSEINFSVPSFPPTGEIQVTLMPLDDTTSTQPPSDSLKQCPEFVGTEYLLEESQFFPSNTSSQQVHEAYLPRVIENSLAELSPMAEELPQAPVGGSLSHYVASLNKHFSPSEEETTSSSSSSSDESSSSEEEVSSSSSSEQEHLSTSEHEAASVLRSQVYPVPEIQISSVSEGVPCTTPDEQQQTEAASQNVVVASMPEEVVDSVPEKVTASVSEEVIASGPEKVVVSVPQKVVDSVPEIAVVSVPEKVIASVPEKVPDCVPEKMVASVPEKMVDSVPEKVVASVPEKMVASVPEKMVASVPEKLVDSVPEKLVASVPEKVVASVPEKVVASVPEKVVASVPEKVVASVPQKMVASVPKKTLVSSEPKKVMFSSVPENVLAMAVACSEPERGVASVLENVVICPVPETVVISSSSQEEVSSSSEEEISAHSGIFSLSLQEAGSLPQSLPSPDVSSNRKDNASSSQQLDFTSSIEEEATSSSEQEPSPTREYEASFSASQVSSVPDIKISLTSDAECSITPDEKPENFLLPDEVVPAPEVVASSTPEKVMVSSEPERDRISSLPTGDSPSSERVSPSSDEISSSTEDDVPSVPKITISFAPDMECPYASDTEEAVVSAPEKVPSLVQEEEVSFVSGTSSRPDAQHEASSTAQHKSSTPKEETFEIRQFYGSPSQSCDISTPLTEASSIVRQGKIPSSASGQQSQGTEGSPPQSHSASTHQVNHPVTEPPKEVQEGSLTQATVSSPPPTPVPATPAKHSAAQTKCSPPTMEQCGSAPRAPVSSPQPRPPPMASPKPSSAQATRPTPPIKPSVKPPLPPTQPSSARSPPPIKPSVKPPLPPRPTQPSTSRCPPPVKPSVKPPLPPKPTQSSTIWGATTKHSSQSATEPLSRQAPAQPLHELFSSQAQLGKPVTSLVPGAELKKKDKEDETEWKEGRKRGISQSSEETEEEYFTPPSGSPPHSPVQVRNQASFKDFGRSRRQWSPHQEGAEKNIEFVTWGHELEVIVDPSQLNEISDAGTFQAPPDAGKRHSQPDLSDLPSTKRRRLSGGEEEDDFKNVLTVCRVRSRSPSPSRRRFSRLTSAIEEALNAEQPEQSYEIQITVSVLKPSHSPQTTSPEPRVRISTHMRPDSPAPPSQRPSRPAPPPPDKSVRSKEKKKEKATTVSSSDAASPPLSPSVSGESASKGKSRIEKSKERKSRKKREHEDGSATRKTTVTSLKEGKKEEEKEKEEKEEENEAAKRAMMEFYVNNLSSDTDSDASTSSTSTSTSSSDDDGEDDGRSYQVTAPGEMGLATIEEDAEEDSGAESSGHWMFSADNTDTESVIHVPAALTPAPIEPPPLHRPPEDGDSTASDETLVVEEEDDEEERDVCGGSEGRGGRQEAGVTVSNSHARTPATTPATGGHYDSSASEDEHGSQGTERPADGSSLRAVHRRRRKPGDGRPAGGGARLPQANMLGPAHATRIFEKHVDDVFDFESLESCESVSGGSEASSPGHPGSLSGLEEADVVFNMSATSQPFADVSPTLVGSARKKYTSGGAAGVPEDLEGSVILSEPRDGDGAPCLIPTPGVAPAGMGGEENEGDLSNVLSSAGTDLVLSSSNSDSSQAAEGHSGPQSMDMFGLPMRWTPGHDPRQSTADTTITAGNRNTTQAEAEESMIQMRSECDELTFANKETHLNTSFSSPDAYSSDRQSSRAAVSSDADLAPPPEGVKTSVSDATQEVRSAASEAQQQEIVSVSAFIVGENSSEARHRHTPHGPAHHYHFSLAPLPQQSESEALLLPPSGVSDQDDVQDAMRDVPRPPLLRGDTATKAAVGSFPCGEVTSVALDEKAADYYTSGEAEYVSPGLRPQPVRSMPCGVDFPSVDSDTDTDNTDGDYDEEDHFAAELSLRISSVPATATTKVKSFRSSDILNLIGLQGGGAGSSGAGGASGDVSPPASQTGSSPEVPDSLRSSEGRSATRSVETLSEDSGLGDRDVQLTPSSPLASISEAAPRLDPAAQAPVSATSRLRRQDVRQARIARARSCGDLRGYTDSDSEEERGAMYGWPSHPSTQPLTEGVNGASYGSRTQPRPYKPNYTNHLQQHQQHDEYRAARLPHRPHPLSGSEGSDEEFRSRFTNHRVVPSGHSKPRRHRSFHEASRQDPAGWAGKGSWATTPGAPRPGRRRPQPISVDLAEQFLSQEGLKSPQRKQTVEDPYGAAGEGRGEEWRMQHPPSLPGTGGVACQAARSMPANQQPPSEVSTTGASVGSAGSGSEPCPPASSLTPELTVRRAWPAAEAALPPLATPSRPAPAPPSTRPPAPAPLSPQYSSTPAQLPNECQPVHTGRSSSSPAHDPPSNTDSELRAASDLNEQCFSGSKGADAASSDGVTSEMEGGPARVHTKTYGSHGEVEVYLARSDSGCRPPNTSPILTPRGGSDHRSGSRGVTFSPSVKEINWRESYYEAEPEEGEEAGSSVRKVLVVTSESPTPQRVDLTPSPPPAAHVPTSDSQIVNNTPETSPSAPADSVCDTKTNGRVSEGPAGSSSDAEMSEDKSPRVQTPLWQRFRLPKISSPKSPRPKIPPKPQSLSSRSSDTESSKLSSPGMDSSSSTPSSPDTKAKKAPASPRFFSWGSKREKKARVPPPRPVVSPPPPPAQVNAGQRGEVPGEQAGVKGEPDPAAAVSPAVLPREDRAGASENNSETVRREQQSVWLPTREERVTVFPARPVATERPCFTDSDGLSHESGRSPLTSATSGEDSSDAAPYPSPRSALSKPPLPPHLQRPNQQVFHKARLLSARRQYFSQERQVSAPERSSPPKEVPAPPVSKPREALQQRISTSRYNSAFNASSDLKERFERFSASARAERERLARSTPDLSVIEASVRRQGPRIDLWNQCEQQQQQAESHPASPASASDGDAARPDLAHRGASSSHQKARAAIHERYKNRAQRIHARARTQSSGVLETDLDTGASREVLTLRETNLDDLYRDLQHLLDTIPPVGAAPTQADKTRAKSLLDLEATAAMEAQLAAPARPPDTRAKSMEFLLDDGNKASIQPPENELMKGSERQLSEAELRVRRSLQRLDVPEWMKNAPPPQQGFLLRRREYGSSSAPAGGWSAYSSKTASMTSLGSSRAVTPNTPTKVVIPTRVASRGVGGIGGVTSPASNCSISPSPSDRSGSLFQYPISRWSTSRLNSGTTTPTGSVTSSRTTTTYTRQPYLGWRSQTSLASLAGSQSSLTSTGSYLTAADRLALGITSYSQRFVKTTPSTQDKENSSSEANAAAPKPETAEQNDTGSTNGSVKLQVPADVADVHSSIKEVTSAIVHYCNESTPSPRASPRGSPRPDGRAPSPRRLVWVESSFVGSRPITSPETPTSSTHAITPTSQLNGHDLPESGEVTSRPPQPPGEYLLAW